MDRAVTHPRRGQAIRSEKVRQRRSRVYDDLLAAGAARFAARGVDQVSVEELIEAVGISRRTFYGFFANKYAIVAALLNPIFSAGVERLEALAAGPPADILPGVVAMYLELWRGHAAAMQVIGKLNADAFAHIEPGHREFGRALRAALSRCEASGLLLNDSADYSFRIISRTAVPLLKIYHDHPDPVPVYTRSMLGLLARPDRD